MATLRVPYSSLAYDRSAGRYRQSDGRFMSQRSVRFVVENDIDQTRYRINKLARLAQRGDLTVQEWLEAHNQEVKNLHLCQMAAAKGGIHNLTQEDYGRAGQLIKEQYAYSNNRAAIAAADPNYLQSDRWLSDCEMYADAGLGTFETIRDIEENRVGNVISVNVLEEGAHHCEPRKGIESCQQQTDKSPCPSSQMRRVTKRACGPRCRCDELRFPTMEAAWEYMREHGMAGGI